MKEKKIVFEKLKVEEKEKILGGKNTPKGLPECGMEIGRPQQDCG